MPLLLAASNWDWMPLPLKVVVIIILVALVCGLLWLLIWGEV